MRGYCPSCERTVTVTKTYVRNHGEMQCCAACESLMVYRNVEEFVAETHKRVMRTINCDHRFEAVDHGASKPGVCDFCQRNEDDPLVEYARQR